MNKFLALLAACTFLTACSFPDAPPPDARDVQAVAAKTAANNVRFSGNAEIEAITKRLELTSKPVRLVSYFL